MEVAVRDRRGELAPGQRSIHEHRAQDLVAPLERIEGPVDGVEDRGRLWQAREQGRLVQRQRPSASREVRLRGGLDPVGVVPVVDRVHVGAEDPVLRLVPRELDRKTGFLDLPLERPLAGDVEVANELLRDRRSALDDIAGAEVADRGPDDSLVVDAAVPVEAPVLDRDRGLRHPRAHLREGDRLAILLGGDRAQQRAVRGVDEGVCGPALRTGRNRAELGQAAAGLEGSGTAEPDRDDPADDRHEHDRDDRRVAPPLLLDAQPALLGAPDQLVEVVGAPTASAPSGRRAHPKTPAARKLVCARIRRSLSSRSASIGPEARARTTIVAFPFRPVTLTCGSRSSATVFRNSSTTARRSLSNGICTVISATFSRPTIVELRIVSEANFSFGMTSRSPSSLRINVYVSAISSTVPMVPSTSTRSPSRMGWVKAISRPATKFPIVRCEANPITIPSTADEASRPPATARTWGITRRAESTPMKTTAVVTVRRKTRYRVAVAGVRSRRAIRRSIRRATIAVRIRTTATTISRCQNGMAVYSGFRGFRPAKPSTRECQ